MQVGTTGNYPILTASRATFKVGDIEVGWASGVSWSITTNWEPTRVLDRLAVAEHVATTHDVTLTCNAFCLSGYSLRKAGIMPKYADILTTGVLTASINDDHKYPTPTGELAAPGTIVTFTDVRCASSNYSVTAGGVNAEDITFVAILWHHQHFHSR